MPSNQVCITHQVETMHVEWKVKMQDRNSVRVWVRSYASLCVCMCVYVCEPPSQQIATEQVEEWSVGLEEWPREWESEKQTTRMMSEGTFECTQLLWMRNFIHLQRFVRGWADGCVSDRIFCPCVCLHLRPNTLEGFRDRSLSILSISIW